VRYKESFPIPRSPIIPISSKLLIFNVHGTLLDCSLLDERNPNNRIRPTLKASGRKVICRPWMAEFLSQCFLTFKVAFWDSKSARYMEDMVSVMLGRLKGQQDRVSCFVWSG
jgi:hypothetical protein